MPQTVLSPVGDPLLVQCMGAAMNDWLQNNPDAGCPRDCRFVTYRLSKATGLVGVTGKLLVFGWHKNGKKLWGVFEYVDGKILPGDGIGPENLQLAH